MVSLPRACRPFPRQSPFAVRPHSARARRELEVFVRVQRAAAIAWIAAGILSGATAVSAQDPKASPTPPPSPPPATTTSVLANLPVRLYANVNLRQDYQRPQDKADLLLAPNQNDGLLTRL